MGFVPRVGLGSNYCRLPTSFWKLVRCPQQAAADRAQAVDRRRRQLERGRQVLEVAPLRGIRQGIELDVDAVVIGVGWCRERHVRARALTPQEGPAARVSGLRPLVLLELLAQKVDRLERVVVDRGAGRGVQDLEHARRLAALVPVQIRVRPRVDDDDHELPDPAVIEGVDEAPGAVVGSDRFQGTAQADVVGDPAIQKVDPGALRVQVALREPGLPVAARVGLVVLARLLDPGRRPVAAIAGIALDRERAEQDREGGGRRHGAPERQLREVRAQRVEPVLGQGEARARRHVGRVDDDERPAAVPEQVGIGGAAEDLPVVVFRREVDPIEGRRRQPQPVDRRAQLLPEVGLDVAFEERALEVVEGALALQGIVGSGEAAAGHRRDHVDLVEQGAALALPDDRGRAQRLEDAVGERGRAGAAAGEGEHDEQAVGVVLVGEAGEAVAGPGIVVRERRVERELGAAAGEGQRCERQRPPAAVHQATFPARAACGMKASSSGVTALVPRTSRSSWSGR